MTLSPIQRLNLQLAALEGQLVPRDADLTNRKARVVIPTGDGGELAESRTFSEWKSLTCEQRFPSLFDAPPSKEDAAELLQLERDGIALGYRANLFQVKPGCNEVELEQQLTTVLTRYRRNPSLYPGCNDRSALSRHDQNQIKEVCQRFPAFADALIRRNRDGGNRDLWTMQFVKFALRSPERSCQDARQWVEIFVCYPHEVDWLMAHTFDKRCGAVDPSLISIRKDDDNLDGPALGMKFNGKWTRIQGEEAKKATVRLPNIVRPTEADYTRTIEQVAEQFKRKRCGYENVEVIERKGIINWDTIKLGSFNPDKEDADTIRVREPNWLSRLPVFKTMTAEQIRERYVWQDNWDGQSPVMAVCATREKPTLQVDNNHGYLEIIIPHENGLFRIIPIGFQPNEFPDLDAQCSMLDKLWVLEKIQPGKSHTIDESFFLSNRQFRGEAYALTGDEFGAVQDRLTHFETKARAGKKTFHPMGDNCAKMVQKVYERTVGQRFYGPFVTFAERILGADRGVGSEIKRINKGLDDDALSKLAEDLASALIARPNPTAAQAELMTLCLNTLRYSLNGGRQIEGLDVIQDAMIEKIAALRANGKLDNEVLKRDLIALIKLTIESQQFFKISFWDIELNAPVVSSIFNFIKYVRDCGHETIADLFLRFFLMLIGSWRGYTYEKKDGTSKTRRAWSHPYHTRAMNLPAKFFKREEQSRDRAIEVQKILARLQPSSKAAPAA